MGNSVYLAILRAGGSKKKMFICFHITFFNCWGSTTDTMVCHKKAEITSGHWAILENHRKFQERFEVISWPVKFQIRKIWILCEISSHSFRHEWGNLRTLCRLWMTNLHNYTINSLHLLFFWNRIFDVLI